MESKPSLLRELRQVFSVRVRASKSVSPVSVFSPSSWWSSLLLKPHGGLNERSSSLHSYEDGPRNEGVGGPYDERVDDSGVFGSEPEPLAHSTMVKTLLAGGESGRGVVEGEEARRHLEKR